VAQVNLDEFKTKIRIFGAQGRREKEGRIPKIISLADSAIFTV